MITSRRNAACITPAKLLFALVDSVGVNACQTAPFSDFFRHASDAKRGRPLPFFVLTSPDIAYRASITPVMFVLAFIDKPSRDVGLFRPFVQRLCFVLDGQCSGNSCITRLSRFIRPAHVSRFIMTVVVNAVDRMLRRGLTPKFGKKCLIGFKSKLNTPAAISFICLIGGRVTAASSRYICFILGRAFTVSGLAVNEAGRLLPSQTPARYTAFRTGRMKQVTPSDNGGLAAVTDTKPAGRVIYNADALKNEQASECHSEQIKNPRSCQIFRNWFRIDASHFDLRIRLISARLRGSLTRTVGPFLIIHQSQNSSDPESRTGSDVRGWETFSPGPASLFIRL